jgi:hypothetical protein
MPHTQIGWMVRNASIVTAPQTINLVNRPPTVALRLADVGSYGVGAVGDDSNLQVTEDVGTKLVVPHLK